MNFSFLESSCQLPEFSMDLICEPITLQTQVSKETMDTDDEEDNIDSEKYIDLGLIQKGGQAQVRSVVNTKTGENYAMKIYDKKENN